MIIDAKLSIPKTRGTIVEREHLFLRLDEGLKHKLTFIQSPAGYGKSTLLSEWVLRRNIQASWVSLDRRDNEFLSFWRHVIQSLSHFESFAELTTKNYIHAENEGHALIAILINHFHRVSEEIVLILDDFHLIENKTILQSIEYLLEQLPAHIHVYIASRCQPALSLSKLRLEGNVVELGLKELQFTKEETLTFFKECMNLSLSTKDFETIYYRLEGWAAGLRVAALYVNSHVSLSDLITGKQEVLANYFLEEVLEKQTEEMQQFLMKTAILDQMNATLVEELTNIPNGAFTLYQIEREHLFLVSLDHQREWYRYHRLFQEFLQLQLQLHHPEKVKKLHNAAGEWLEKNGYLKEGLAHYISGENYAAAIQLLHKLIPTLQNYDRLKLYKIMDKIPNDILIESPELFLMNTAALFLSGYKDQAIQQYWWAVNFLKSNSHHISENVKIQYEAGLDFLTAMRYFLEKDFDSFVLYSGKYLAKESSGNLLVGFGSEHDDHHPVWDVYISDGELKTAEDILGKLTRMWAKTENKPFYAHLCIDYGKLLYEKNDLIKAEKYLTEAYKIGKTYENVLFIVKSSLMLAKIDVTFQRMNLANIRIEKLFQTIDEEEHPMLIRKIKLFQMRLLIRQKEEQRVIDWLVNQNLRLTDEISYATIGEYDLLLRMTRSTGNMRESFGLINRLLFAANEAGNNRTVLRLSIHKSYLLFQQRKRVESFQLLEDILALGNEVGYVRTFLDEGLMFGKLLQQYSESISSNHYRRSEHVSRSQVSQLLESFIHEGIIFYDEQSGRLLTEREVVVLEHIYEGFSNKEIASKLNIALSTVKTHINNLYRKLAVNNRIQAVQKAQEMNIITVL